MKIVVFLSILLSIGFTSTLAETHHGMNEHNQRQPLDLKHKAQLVGVLEVNELLHAAFFTYNSENIEKIAKKLSIAIDGVRHGKASTTLAPVKKILLKLKSKNKKEDNNIAYHKASILLAKIVNTYDVGKSYNVYSCPMVKMLWIQNSIKQLRTHNPYAPEMPHCGGRDTEY